MTRLSARRGGAFFLIVTFGLAAAFWPQYRGSVARAGFDVAQQPTKWEGACARCGEGYSWLGAQRPIQNKCNRFGPNGACNGAIIWQPVFQ